VAESDGDLVRATMSGRAGAFEELVRRYSARVYGLCWTRLGRRETVADMVQEAFLRAFRALKTLTEPEKFGSWLCGIAVRACLDWLKDRERSQVSFGALGPDHDPSEFLPGRPSNGSDPLEEDERRRRILDEVQSLPEIYREAVVMFYFENRSYAQMMQSLAIGPQAINARLSKARGMLRERLKTVAR
jgi:RNA polymerase sigma-70 factor (ECF subfamily)